MLRSVCFLLCAAALTVLGSVSTASADLDKNDRYDPRRLYGGLWLGFGGDAELDNDGEFGGDLETTVGGQVGLDWVTWRYLSLGFEGRVGAVKWKSADRSKLIDFDFKPRLRFPLTGTPVELYATAPVGITIPRLAKVGDVDPDANVGWNIGAGAGINVFLTDAIALNAEPIWLMHKFGVEGPGPIGDAKFVVKQFSLMINIVFAL